MMKQVINILSQLNGIGSELQESTNQLQLDWTAATGEKHRLFSSSYPTPACFISHVDISEFNSPAESKQKWINIRSEEYRDKTIYTHLRDMCRQFITLIRFQGVQTATV